MDKILFDSLFKSVEITQKPDEFLELLQWLEIKKNGIDGIIEVGVLKGGTALFWQILLIPDGIYIGIDIDEKDYFPEIRARFNADQRMQFIKGDSASIIMVEECEKRLNGKKIDILFIDGNHSAEYIRADYLNYKDFLKSDGLIIFHDVHHPEYPEIGRFFNRLSKLPEYFGMKFIGSDKPFGIGALIKK